MSVTLLIIILVSLIFLSAFFSAAETAFTSLSRYQVDQLARSESFFAKRATFLLKHRETLLATVLVGNTISNVGASAITTMLAIALWGNASVGIASGALTFIILIFAEVSPKQLALRHNDFFVQATCVPVWVFNIILRPIVSVVSLFGYLINFLTGGQKSDRFSLDQLLFLIREGEANGMVESYEKKVVYNLFRLSEVSAMQIMTHRRDIFSLSAETTIAEALPKMIEKNFSRVPVYGKDPEDIIGLVFLNEVYTRHMDGHGNDTLKTMLHKPTFIPATFKVSEVLEIFKKESISLVIALDEYGGLAGIVSQKDILEEILGELYLEHENDEDSITEIEGGWRLPGDTSLHWMEDLLGHSISHDKSVSTISGYLCEQLGRLPLNGELLNFPEGRFHIEEVRDNRVYNVCFFPNFTQEDDERH